MFLPDHYNKDHVKNNAAYICKYVPIKLIGDPGSGNGGGPGAGKQAVGAVALSGVHPASPTVELR